MKRFEGTGVALVTPFDENLAVDRESLRRLVNHVIEGGVDFLVVLGTTAESATLTKDEKAEIACLVVEENRGRLPLMVGVGGNNTQEILRELKEFTWLKDFDAILSITPFYNKPNQEGLLAHFKEIAAVSPLPLCLYNVPGRTGVNMRAETVARLQEECPNIMALKEASGNFEQATRLLETKREDFTLLSGDDAITLPLMALGFEGVISVVANALPSSCARLVNAVRRGDFVEARKMHLALSEVCRAFFEEGNPAGVKAALHVAGIIRYNALRLPLLPASDALYAKIQGLQKRWEF